MIEEFYMILYMMMILVGPFIIIVLAIKLVAELISWVMRAYRARTYTLEEQ